MNVSARRFALASEKVLPAIPPQPPLRRICKWSRLPKPARILAVSRVVQENV